MQRGEDRKKKGGENKAWERGVTELFLNVLKNIYIPLVYGSIKSTPEAEKFLRLILL